MGRDGTGCQLRRMPWCRERECWCSWRTILGQVTRKRADGLARVRWSRCWREAVFICHREPSSWGTLRAFSQRRLWGAPKFGWYSTRFERNLDRYQSWPAWWECRAITAYGQVQKKKD